MKKVVIQAFCLPTHCLKQIYGYRCMYVYHFSIVIRSLEIFLRPSFPLRALTSLVRYQVTKVCRQIASLF